MCKDLIVEFLCTGEDVKGTVEITTEGNILGGTGKGIGAFQDLDIGGIEGDGEVVPEGTFGLEAEDIIELEVRVESAVDIGQAMGR